MPSSNDDALTDLFVFYNNNVKTLYCDIAAQNNTLPEEILFETYSAFDQLGKFHIVQESKSKCLEKAHLHLQCAATKAVKEKFNNYKDDLTHLKKKYNCGLVSNGSFSKNLKASNKHIKNIAKQAKSTNEKLEFLIPKAFENWNKVSILIDEFYPKYYSSENLPWSNSLFNKLSLKDYVIYILTAYIVNLISFLLL